MIQINPLVPLKSLTCHFSLNGHLCPLPKRQLLFTLYKPNQIVWHIVRHYKEPLMLAGEDMALVIAIAREKNADSDF
jgi:hypothetical protein